MTGLRPEPGCLVHSTGCAHHGYVDLEPRNEGRPVSSGVESTTYSTTGCFIEHVNLDPRAEEHVLIGWPPGPVMSRTRGGAFVVVRARESRVHGEGRQSTHAASKAPRKAMYVAPTPKQGWLRSVQRTLHEQSQEPSITGEQIDGLVKVRGLDLARKVDGEPGA